MRRIPLSLAACAFLVACTAGPPPAAPPAVPMPDWTPPDIPRPDPSQDPSRDAEASAGTDGPAEGAGADRRSIYDAPRAKANCAIPAVDEGSRSSMGRYLDKVASCLDQIWARELREVNLLFVPPRRQYVRERVRHPACGLMPSKGADGTYCGAVRTYFILVDPADPRWPWRAWAAEMAAHEYGHHVQHLTRILHYQAAMMDAAATKQARNLVSRRLELQAECFAGVALRAMRRDLPPWDEFQYLYTGTLPKRWILDHGRLTTQYRWLLRGFRSGKPGSCDTWSPPADKVT